jgi:hypothetical protein
METIQERLRAGLPCVETPAMRSDNLAILLASFFEPSIESEELDEHDCWKQGAVDAANEVLDAIHSHYIDTLTSALAAKDEEIERLTRDAYNPEKGMWTFWNDKARSLRYALTASQARIAELEAGVWHVIETENMTLSAEVALRSLLNKGE